VQEKDVDDGDGGKTLASSSSKPHDNTSDEEVSVLRPDCTPYSGCRVECKCSNICRASSVLVDQGHPDEVSKAQEQGSTVEEVRCLRNGPVETSLHPVWEEVLRGLDNRDC